MKEIGLNETVILSFSVRNNQAELYKAIINRIAPAMRIECRIMANAPANSQLDLYGVVVSKIGQLMVSIDMNFGIIEDVQKNWDMGLITPQERDLELSKYMVLPATSN
jgi:hypothetical protein